jgi:hypothetical protein
VEVHRDGKDTRNFFETDKVRDRVWYSLQGQRRVVLHRTDVRRSRDGIEDVDRRWSGLWRVSATDGIAREEEVVMKALKERLIYDVVVAKTDVDLGFEDQNVKLMYARQLILDLFGEDGIAEMQAAVKAHCK